MSKQLELCANTVRLLAADAVQAANSGHPGLPMGLADTAVTLWSRFLKFDPTDPAWPDRDRFILSAGHGSTLHYALLHLAGYDLPLAELKRFRQWESRTPGHPEVGLVPGVETTTGPLGQGLTNGVGMALAERMLAARFNGDGEPLVDHRTWVLAGDGDMMEGVTYEAASLAGHLALGRLTVIYDSNGITIEGDTGLTFTEDVAARFRALGWLVEEGVDGHDPAAVSAALERVAGQEEKPALVIVKTTIGFGSPNLAGTATIHGAPLGAEELAATKTNLGWPAEESFHVPDGAATPLTEAGVRGGERRRQWEARLAAWGKENPEGLKLWRQAMAGRLTLDPAELIPEFAPDPKGMATRVSSGKVLNALAPHFPRLIGGSADLAPSNKSDLVDQAAVAPGAFAGRNLHFGIREHAMGAILNGIALHGGFIPYGATFLVFADYMRPAIRMAALMKQQVIYIFTHDSIGVGEDGPTHQPVEQLASLRLIPNLTVLRPADANEVAQAWALALERTDGPTALVLTRQNLATLDRSILAPATDTRKGGYVLRDAPDFKAIIIATGSEVGLALEAADRLDKEKLGVRVVSLPSWEIFAAQPREYIDSVLPPAVTARVGVEAGVGLGWERWIGAAGATITLDRFGSSGPYQEVFRRFGFTPEALADKVKELLRR